MTGRALVGCSGWMYDDWRDVVYEGLPKRLWFARYAERFETVELNSTFYRLPHPSAVQRWRDAAPTGFVYAVKLGQFASHRMKLRDPRGLLHNHVDRLELLGGHAGPTLVQLPPNWRADVPRLDAFLDAWPHEQYRCAVEVRHRSWLTDDVYDSLHRHDAALCIHDLIPDHPWVRTASWTYVRFHGVEPQVAPYRGRYGPSRLDAPLRKLSAWMDDGCDVYAYFNNDWAANAPTDAAWLARHLHRAQHTAVTRGGDNG